MKSYVTVKEPAEVELVINKSRFIGRCFPIESEQDALNLLGELRKRHWDASHNCFAYRVGVNADTARFSDDGEPGGTAGMPIMDVLSAKALTNVLCVVTRYFGGVLLGAGGLLRAYSKSATESVTQAGVLRMEAAKRVRFSVDYSRYAGLERFIRERTQAVLEPAEFAEAVTLTVLIEDADLEPFLANIIEHTDGRAQPQVIAEEYLPRL